MNYPRIFSISTVGIVKHYNQDYLFHPARTDFTGSNGIGKSIIADLLQLIFVSDRKLVVFGTDGLNPKNRQPHTLPYKTNTAYAFLNLEVKENLFLAIGVCIPNSSNRRIQPFIVTNNDDYNKSLDDICFSRNKLLTYYKFIDNSKIPSIRDLTIHLRDTHNLFLKYFSSKEDKQAYYTFLYEKKITPINLSLDANLKAYARVIQSFSKAKSLDVGSTSSLKNFLFEDSYHLFKESFTRNKDELQKLIVDYRRLEEFIDQLEQKQDLLSELKAKETKQNEAHRELLIAEAQYYYWQSRKAGRECKKKETELENQKRERTALEEKSRILGKTIQHDTEKLRQLKLSMDGLNKYKDKYEELKKVDLDIHEIEQSEPPQLHEDLEDIDIEQFDVKEITRRIRDFKPLYEQYTSLHAMKEKCQTQGKEVEGLKQNIELEIEELRRWQTIFSHQPDGLFAKLVESQPKLSRYQETVLFHLKDVFWQKPNLIELGVKYTDNLDILSQENIEVDADSGGVWLKLGTLNEFIPLRQEKQIFNDPQKLQLALQNSKLEIERKLQAKKQELIEIDKFKRGEPYKILFPTLDQRLKDYSAFENYREIAAIINTLGVKLNRLERKRQMLKGQLKSIAQKNGLEIDGQLVDAQITMVEAKIRTIEKNISKNDKERSRHIGQLQTVDNKVIPLMEGNVQELRKNFRGHKVNYIEKESIVKKSFPNLKIDFKVQIAVNDKDNRKHNYQDAKETYITEYQAVVKSFAETRVRKNPEINEEIDGKKFTFAILEKVLLGSRINHLDNISDQLRESNRQRLRMADAIYEAIVKIFRQTREKYNEYQSVIRGLNNFFKGRKVSNKYFFQVRFTPNPYFSVEWSNALYNLSENVYKLGQLPLGDSVERYVENFFREAANYHKRIQLADLLDPKTYFDLSVSLTDENNKDIPGSTGESYSALVLLGIGRLSKVQNSERPGIRFIILEETANLDRTNFSTFPNIAKEFGYQVITMTPRPYGSDTEQGWFLHHLIPGNDNPNINYPDSFSYYKTNDSSVDLSTYLKTLV